MSSASRIAAGERLLLGGKGLERGWAEHNLYCHAVDRGGHFVAWEQPQLFAEEIRAAFRSLR